jgi:hypothetical protein
MKPAGPTNGTAGALELVTFGAILPGDRLVAEKPAEPGGHSALEAPGEFGPFLVFGGEQAPVFGIDAGDAAHMFVGVHHLRLGA